MTKGTKGAVFLTGGVALSLSSIISFSAAWELVGTLGYIARGAALVASAGALFLFAEGWDRLKTARNAGRISGKIVLPDLPAEFEHTTRIALKSQTGQLAAIAALGPDGTFALTNVEDGVWQLEISGPWIELVRTDIRMQRRERLDLGTLKLRFAESRLWTVELLPIMGQVQAYARDSTGAEWAAGFLTGEKSKNSRVILRRESGSAQWRERILPTLLQAERVTIVRVLGDGTIVIGTLDAGACYSRDNGVTWAPLALPPGLNSISALIELPDKTLVVGAWAFRGAASPSGHVLRFSRIDGEPVTTHVVDGQRVEVLHLTEAGRLLLGTDGAVPAILYSEDYGDTWAPAQISVPEDAYGEFVQFAEIDGVLLTGVRTFRPFSPGYKSFDGGLKWESFRVTDGVSSTYGIVAYQNKLIAAVNYGDNKLGMFSSTDVGSSWKHLADVGVITAHGSIGHFIRCESECIMLALDRLARARLSVLVGVNGAHPIRPREPIAVE